MPTHITAIVLLLSTKVDTHFTVKRRVRGRVDLRHAEIMPVFRVELLTAYHKLAIQSERTKESLPKTTASVPSSITTSTIVCSTQTRSTLNLLAKQIKQFKCK